MIENNLALVLLNLNNPNQEIRTQAEQALNAYGSPEQILPILLKVIKFNEGKDNLDLISSL